MNEAVVKRQIRNWLPLPILFLSVAGIVLAPRLHDPAAAALSLCASALVPALFPSIVLCNIATSFGDFDGVAAALEKPFRCLFRLPGYAGVSALAGMLFGFPLGAKHVADGYDCGGYCKAEANCVLPYVNNPSPAFVIAGIGCGMMQSPAAGVVLFLCVHLSAALLLLLSTRRLLRSNGTAPAPARREPQSAGSILRDSAVTMLGICGCVFFCSLLVAGCGLFFPPAVTDAFAALLEIGTAASRLAGGGTPFRHFLCGFAVGGGGVSAALQSLPYCERTGHTAAGYFAKKALQGTLTGTFFSLFALLL